MPRKNNWVKPTGMKNKIGKNMQDNLLKKI
jgi:hypothetical protein